MPDWNEDDVSRIVLALEKAEYPFPGYHFSIEEGKLKCLGQGSYSRVYEVFCRDNTNKRYAVKVIGLEKGKVSSEKFHQTAWLQRQLGEDCRNIVRILEMRELLLQMDLQGNVREIRSYDGRSDEGVPQGALLLQFLLMEKLDCLIEKDRFWKCYLLREELSDKQGVMRFAAQVGQAICQAHQGNVLHRDIKLENIFWNETQGCYQLGDFGIAKYVQDGNAETVVYTDGYGAPEIERRLADHYDGKADIYSFGICLYLLLNDLKFPGADGYYASQVQYDSNFVFPAPAHSTPEIAKIIRKACSFYPENRYHSMEELLMDLRQMEENEKFDAALMRGYTDRVTETYHEETAEAKASSDRDCKDDFQEVYSTRDEYAEKKALQDSENGLKNRSEERKSTARMRSEIRQDSIHSRRKRMLYECIYVLCVSLILPFFMWGLPGSEQSIVWKWIYWSFPVAVLVESVLLWMRELYVIVGAVVIVYGIGFQIWQGANLPFGLLLACFVVGILLCEPGIPFAVAVGVLLWGIMEFAGIPQWLFWISAFPVKAGLLALFLILTIGYFKITDQQ